MVVIEDILGGLRGLFLILAKLRENEWKWKMKKRLRTYGCAGKGCARGDAKAPEQKAPGLQKLRTNRTYLSFPHSHKAASFVFSLVYARDDMAQDDKHGSTGDFTQGRRWHLLSKPFSLRGKGLGWGKLRPGHLNRYLPSDH